MDCVPIGKKIITVSIQFHGTIIDLNLSPEIDSIFKNTRLFSYAGTYASAHYSISDANKRMRKMQDTFTRDIYDKSMTEQFNEYITPVADKYRVELAKKKVINPELIPNVCKHIGAITVDKLFSKSDRNFIERCIHTYILPDLDDIFVISVHEKIDEYAYRLLSPPEDVYKGLSKLSYFREKGRHDIADMIIAESSSLPDFRGAKNEIDAIENDKTLSFQEKETRTTEIKDAIYHEVQKWKCTVNAEAGELISIRMSMLVQVLKMLYGEDCYIQLIDYSCNEVSMFVPKEQHVYKTYYRPTDIEQGIMPIIGGKKSDRTKKKRRYQRTNAKKRKQTKNKHNINIQIKHNTA